MALLDKVMGAVFGNKSDRDFKKSQFLIEEINRHFESYHDLSDEALGGKTEVFKQRLNDGETTDDLLPEAFAAVKEACRRLLGVKWEVCGIEIEWDMVPFDVQLYGGIVLHQGRIDEMATGEGKTLVATMPMYLNALTGRGVHLVTVNDYLARRDCEWMGKIYEFLGLTVDYIQNDWDHERRKAAYDADITYGTNNEFGFDYLRDNMAVQAKNRVQRGHHYAIVDEVDSVLIDEARTPLIISGPVAHSTHRFPEMKPMVERLIKRQRDLVSSLLTEGTRMKEEGKEWEAGFKFLQAQRGMPKNRRFLKLCQEEGIKQLIHQVETDMMREKRLHQADEDLYFSIDEKGHNINLSEKGRKTLTPGNARELVLPDLSEEIQAIQSEPGLSPTEKAMETEKVERRYAEINEKIHNISQLLKAYSLFDRDVEYVVKDGKVMIVDEFTGRLMPGRRFSDGLHQALEAKEGVTIERETQTWATITLQNYFRLYGKLAGMTGTAETEAPEFWEIYKLEVVVVPTNEPVRRVDYEDRIYRTRREKYNAIVDEIVRMHEGKRPVLVGTVSVDASETLSRLLKRRGIKHNVLNAKYHQMEAEIVSKAGRPGAVTIATNMAGRGTDIKLGPGVVRCRRCGLLPSDSDEGAMADNLPEGWRVENCKEDMPCGLCIIGTARHEARRIDRQLRGRSGRQGDPGSSRFFLSLEDDLMRLFGSERISRVMDRMGAGDGDVIVHPLITKAIQNAQKRVEGYNFDIRKHLIKYDDVMNSQREVIYDRRAHILDNEDISEDIREVVSSTAEALVLPRVTRDNLQEEWDWTGLEAEFNQIALRSLGITDDERTRIKQDELVERVGAQLETLYSAREAELGPEMLRYLERMVNLQVIDRLWQEHLYELDNLKGGIQLRAYGQKDPLLEYKSEGFKLFSELLDRIDQEVLKFLFRVRVAPREEERRTPALRTSHTSVSGFDGGGAGGSGTDAAAAGDGSRRGAMGRAPQKPSPVHAGPKIGRNDPCPCGSGKKYKKCCGRKAP